MDKLIELFKSYLETEKLSIVSSKNYLIDNRHFLEWYILHLRTSQIEYQEDNPQELVSLITTERVNLYKSFLINNKTKIKTINRRLSTIRKLCSFGVGQGWLNTNPAKEIQNSTSFNNSEHELIIKEFKRELATDNVNTSTIQNYIVDTLQFLNFLKTTQ